MLQYRSFITKVKEAKKPRYIQNNVVTEYAIIMTEAHSELTNGDLNVVFNEGANKINYEKSISM